mmetsp:Transcript_45230/g.115739  ORF Transcript_45230/g.115739 Transcript_45230/m.115739 type:complete len:236 (+) Transcript_45230:680-1387(+)
MQHGIRGSAHHFLTSGGAAYDRRVARPLCNQARQRGDVLGWVGLVGERTAGPLPQSRRSSSSCSTRAQRATRLLSTSSQMVQLSSTASAVPFSAARCFHQCIPARSCASEAACPARARAMRCESAGGREKWCGSAEGAMPASAVCLWRRLAKEISAWRRAWRRAAAPRSAARRPWLRSRRSASYRLCSRMASSSCCGTCLATRCRRTRCSICASNCARRASVMSSPPLSSRAGEL